MVRGPVSGSPLVLAILKDGLPQFLIRERSKITAEETCLTELSFTALLRLEPSPPLAICDLHLADKAL